MITPAFTGQYYQDTTTKKLWKANSTTPGDWTAVGNINKSGAGDPTGVETPDFTGQTYRDTATGNIWTSTGLTNADWSLTVQDAKIFWTPSNLSLNNTVLDLGPQNLSTMTFVESVISVSYSLVDSVNLTEVQFPNLTQIDDDLGTNWGGVFCSQNSDLVTLGYPVLAKIGGGILCQYNSKISSLNFPELTTLINDSLLVTDNDLLQSVLLPKLTTVGDNDFQITDNPQLTLITVPLLIMREGITVDCSTNALNLASVDGILAACVRNASFTSDLILINLGTNAAPTQGAGSAHDVLVARGVTIFHN